MVEIFVPIVAMITTFGTIFGVFYIGLTTRNKERLALIEKGMDAKIFETKSKPMNTLRIGFLFIGVAIGITLGYALSYLGMDEGAAYTSMIFLFGGLGLVIHFFIEKKMKKE